MLYFQDTCYKPFEFLNEEQRERKVETFRRGYKTVSSSATRCFLLEQVPSLAD